MGKTTKKGEEMDAVKIILTSLLSIAALFSITKLMGHRQVAELDFFDYITGITVGSIAAELATELEEPMRPLVAIGVYGAVSIILSLLTRKMPKTRRFVNGSATPLIKNGVILKKNLKRAKLDLSELLLMCREAGYFDISEIDTALFEHNGRLSVLPKAKYRPLNPDDVKITADEVGLFFELIMDGRTIKENLKKTERDEKWLKREVKKAGFRDTGEVFLALYRPLDDNLQLFREG